MGPPTDLDLVLQGFPLWLIVYGFTDFQIKLKKLTNINTNTIVVIKSRATYKPFNYPIVPISQSFINNTSPYETELLDADKLQFYPMQQYQEEVINKIAKTGPGTPYIENYQSENIQAFCKFYFKWGGSPPKHISVENPSEQIIYPIPRTEYDTTSLQNPAQAPETTLYSFDYRRGDITKRALQRIADDWSTKTIISSITEPNTKQQLQETFQALQEMEGKEHSQEEKIQLQLHHLRHEQQCLRERIIYLLTGQ